MAFLSISNVAVRGVSACVPRIIDDNRHYHLEEEEKRKMIASLGVTQKRITTHEVCSSDLCHKAAETLIRELQWDKEEIDCLVFVSQTTDYILPATSCILQERIGLKEECLTLDISLGCSGWIYGLSTISSLVASGKGNIKKALLLVGDTVSKITSKTDKSLWPLIGDAGTATAIEYSSDIANTIKFHLATDGSGANAIVIKDGGYRNPVTPVSFEVNETEKGIKKSNLDVALNGMDVFSFAITQAPKSIKKLIDNFGIEKESIDYFTFHQANYFLNEKIRKKLRLEPEKVPYSIENFGNTSGASIPLTMVTELNKKMRNEILNHICCGFGVGLSWGSVYFSTNKIVCPELIDY